MRSRDVQLNFRLSQTEADKLNGFAKRSGLKRESYLRQLLRGFVHMDRPPTEHWDMMREIYAIGNNQYQITHMARALKLPDLDRYEELDARISQLSLAISGADLPIKCKEILPPERKVKRSQKRGKTESKSRNCQ